MFISCKNDVTPSNVNITRLSGTVDVINLKCHASLCSDLLLNISLDYWLYWQCVFNNPITTAANKKI